MVLRKIEKSETIEKIERLLKLKLNYWRLLYLTNKKYVYSNLAFVDDEERRTFHIIRQMLLFTDKILRYSEIETMHDFRAHTSIEEARKFKTEFVRLYRLLYENNIRLFKLIN